MALVQLGFIPFTRAINVFQQATYGCNRILDVHLLKGRFSHFPLVLKLESITLGYISQFFPRGLKQMDHRIGTVAPCAESGFPGHGTPRFQDQDAPVWCFLDVSKEHVVVFNTCGCFQATVEWALEIFPA